MYIEILNIKILMFYFLNVFIVAYTYCIVLVLLLYAVIENQTNKLDTLLGEGFYSVL